MANRRGIAGHSGPCITSALALAALTRSVSHDPACGGHAPCYSTIQAAVTAAQPGDTVRVLAGTYVEQVEVQVRREPADDASAHPVIP